MIWLIPYVKERKRETIEAKREKKRVESQERKKYMENMMDIEQKNVSDGEKIDENDRKKLGKA